MSRRARRVLSTGLMVACLWPLRAADAQEQPGVSVRAVYETRLAGAGAEEGAQRWTFVRRESDLEYHFVSSAITERWSRDVRANASFVRVFHRERVAVRYTSGDLDAHGVKPDWIKLTHVIAPPRADQARAGKVTRMFGYEAQHFRHRRGTQRIEVAWITALGLPAEVRVIAPGSPRIIVRLIELSTERSAALDLRSFRQIDVTDFGDMERDRFVRRHQEDPLPPLAPSLVLHRWLDPPI